jgi:hypothetical protein
VGAAVILAGCARGPAWPADVDFELFGPSGERADIADPHTIRVDDAWVLYGTRTASDLEAWSSEDLATWSYEGVIWSPTPGAWNDHPTVWAPHVDATDDGFFLYYVANGRIGLATSDAAFGPFEDVGPEPFVGGGHGGVGDGTYTSEDYDVEDPDDFLGDAEEYAIDPFVYAAPDGALTLYFAALTPFSVIAAVPLADRRTVGEAAPTVVLGPDPNVDWESLNREAPWVYAEGDRVALMYSGNYWWTADYAIGTATSASPLGPFTRDDDEPWFASDPARGAIGPGHHSVAPGRRDDERLLFYHSKVDATDRSARRTRYARLLATGAPPVFSEP